jgi:hypothetical protein
MNKNLNRSLDGLIQNYKAYGHACKGRGKRAASKSRRKVDRALCKVS